MARKCDWRYAPKTVIVHDGPRFMKQQVVSARIYPPGTAPAHAPIVKTATALELIARGGKSRWFGVDDAKINSQLRVVACGGFINPRNELAREWKPCKKACDELSGTLAGARRSRKRRRKTMTAAQLRDKLACKVFGGKACK